MAATAALRDCAQILAGLLAQTHAESGKTSVPTAGRESGAAVERADDQATQLWIAETLGRRPEGMTLAFLLIDLDRFHALNEVLGAATGDLVLDRTRSRICSVLGSGESLLRLAGDRFGIVAERVGSDPRSLADRLLRTIARPMDLGGRRVSVQASIGIVDQLAPDVASAAVLTQAVSALRRAKHDGRNRYALHVPAIETIDQDRSHLEFDLAHALPEGQMHVVFQPYLSLESGEITGAEALLRWRHPTRGDIRPANFVPLAEATGLILPLGAWTLRTSLALAARWPERLALSVNISALQFHQPQFVEEVDAALERSGFPPERLELEITETGLMRDNSQTVSQLEALIARGIRIALDDFGTGYSALAYLARLPHHRIKLDRSFVQDLANPATAVLIRAIIASARAQGVAITAEGIETAAQLEAVRSFGFTHAQGFATGAPIADPTELFGRVPA
jgi:diguanylate cyclase (GGDEF)-like protein